MSEHVKIMFIFGFDISSASKLCIALPVFCHGLYVMHEGLPVMQSLLVTHRSACYLPWSLHHVQRGLPVMQRVCLSHTMTEIMIHACRNHVMIQMC